MNAGIPDFRSPKKGIYAQASRFGAVSGPGLFDVGNFYQNPMNFYDMMNEIFLPALEGNIK